MNRDRSKTGQEVYQSLNERQRRFVDAYLIDPNAARAAREAGYKQVDTQGPRLLGIVRVQAALAERNAERMERVEIEQDDVLRRLWTIATANPNELIQHRHIACRYCHGLDHAYQWKTEREFRVAFEQGVRDLFPGSADNQDAARQGQLRDSRLPNDAGGYGYRATMEPHPDCPECAGLGIPYTHVADTRNLTAEAAILYDGVKETQHGIEVKTQDRQRALENVAKHLGMFKEKVDPEETNPLSEFIQQVMAAAQSVPVATTQPPNDSEEVDP